MQQFERLVFKKKFSKTSQHQTTTQQEDVSHKYNWLWRACSKDNKEFLLATSKCNEFQASIQIREKIYIIIYIYIFEAVSSVMQWGELQRVLESGQGDECQTSLQLIDNTDKIHHIYRILDHCGGKPEQEVSGKQHTGLPQ